MRRLGDDLKLSMGPEDEEGGDPPDTPDPDGGQLDFSNVDHSALIALL